MNESYCETSCSDAVAASSKSEQCSSKADTFDPEPRIKAALRKGNFFIRKGTHCLKTVLLYGIR